MLTHQTDVAGRPFSTPTRWRNVRPWLGLAWLWLGAALASGQIVPPDQPIAEADRPEANADAAITNADITDADTDWITRLVFDEPPAAGTWIEVASLIADVEPFVVFFDPSPTEVPEALDPGLPQGPAMVCHGVGRSAGHDTTSPTVDGSNDRDPDEPPPAVASGSPTPPTADDQPSEAGIFCRRAFLYRGEASLGPPADDELEIRFDVPTDNPLGTPMVGRYRRQTEPIVGARVALVPLDLGAEQGYVMPLGRAAGPAPRLEHRVTTDIDGQFRLPPVPAGRYFLETLLPSGRIHRTEPIDLPDLTTVRHDFGPEPPTDLAFDLGVFDVAGGLSLTVTAETTRGEPIEGARVVARQGRTPNDLATYAARTNAEGQVELTGFDVDRPTRLGCSAPGHVPVHVEVDLVPVVWTCVLDPLARVVGVVQGPTDVLPAGVTVTARPSESEISPASPETVSVDGQGAFRLDLPAGQWDLVVAAPGLVPLRQVLFLATGDREDLGVLSLLPGRALALTVVDAETAAPIAGATVRAIDPPGAVDTVTDAEGKAQTIVDDEQVIGLAITAEADGYAATEVRILPGEREPRRVTLSRGGWIRVVGCHGCRLSIVPGNHRLDTDSGGSALSMALTPKWYDVVRPRFEHLGTTVVEVPDAERRRVRVRAGRVATVRFEPTEDRLIVRPARPLEGSWRLEARTPWATERALAQPDGSWRLAADDRGTPRDRWLSIHGYDPAAEAEIRVYQATLPAAFEGETFALPIGRGEVRGRLQSGGIGFSGTPAAGVRVRLLRFDDGFVIAEVHTDTEGRFHIPYLPAGTYALHLGDRTYQFLVISPGQRLDAGTFQIF